jgi:hypothetical protein
MTQHVGDLLWREVRVHSHILHVVTSRYYAVVAIGKVRLLDGGRSWTLSPPFTTHSLAIQYIRTCLDTSH